MKRKKQIEELDVAGGEYRVASWPGTGTAILAVHGITASHMAWPTVVDLLAGDNPVIAPDLRGRGHSNTLPPPYGFKQHIADLLATLDHFGIDKVIFVGHSLGAYIGLDFATYAPERVHGLVLVDGGIALPMRPGTTPEQIIKAILGPALARLDMKFVDEQAYLDYWKAHPAFQDPGAWSPEVEAYIAYDIAGAAPAVRSRVNKDAILTDAHDPLAPGMATRIDGLKCPMLLLTAPRGLLNQPEPLLPKKVIAEKVARIPNLRMVEIADTNHYTIVTGSGRERLARHIDEFARQF